MTKNLQKHLPFRKSIALVLVFTFTFSNLGLANIATAGNSASEVNIPSLAARIEIPETYGTISGRFIPSETGAGTIIHIQDAHASLEAQEHIRQTLHYLKAQYGFDFVLVEGGIGELQADRLQAFPDKPLNQELAELLVKRGVLSGSERFLLDEAESARGPLSRMLGVEDGKLYEENLNAYRQVTGDRSENEKFLEALRIQIVTEGSRTMNPKLQKFFKEWALLQGRSQEFSRQLETLKKYADSELRTDFNKAETQAEWPQLVRIYKLSDLEAHVSVKNAQSELAALKQWIQEKKIETAESESVLGFTLEKGFAAKPEKGTRFLLETFFASVKPVGFSFTQYPALSQVWGRMILREEIDAALLFDEISRLTDSLLNHLAVTPEEKKVIESYQDYLLLTKVMKLELTDSDYAEVLKKQNELRPTAIAQPFKGAALSVSGKQDAAFSSSLEFYQKAKARDQVMFDKMLSQMKASDESNAIIVSGGFHSQGLQAHLKEKGMAFVEIQPRISDLSQTADYEKAMMLEGAFEDADAAPAVSTASFPKPLTDRASLPSYNNYANRVFAASRREIAVKHSVKPELQTRAEDRLEAGEIRINGARWPHDLKNEMSIAVVLNSIGVAPADVTHVYISGGERDIEVRGSNGDFSGTRINFSFRGLKIETRAENRIQDFTGYLSEHSLNAVADPNQAGKISVKAKGVFSKEKDAPLILELGSRFGLFLTGWSGTEQDTALFFDQEGLFYQSLLRSEGRSPGFVMIDDFLKSDPMRPELGMRVSEFVNEDNRVNSIHYDASTAAKIEAALATHIPFHLVLVPAEKGSYTIGIEPGAGIVVSQEDKGKMIEGVLEKNAGALAQQGIDLSNLTRVHVQAVELGGEIAGHFSGALELGMTQLAGGQTISVFMLPETAMTEKPDLEALAAAVAGLEHLLVSNRLIPKVLIADKLEKTDGIFGLEADHIIEIVRKDEIGKGKDAAWLLSAIQSERPDVLLIRSDSKVTEEVLRALSDWPRYKAPIVVRVGADTNNVATAKAEEMGVVVARTHGNENSVANVMLRLMFSFLNRIHPGAFSADADFVTVPSLNDVMDVPVEQMIKGVAESTKKGRGTLPDAQRDELFAHRTFSQDPKAAFENTRIALVGFGVIPKVIAGKIEQLSHELNVTAPQIMAWTRSIENPELTGTRAEDVENAGLQAAKKEQILKEANVISLHLPGNAPTFLDAQALKVLAGRTDSPIAIINTARLKNVDHEALLAAMEAKQDLYYYADIDLTADGQEIPALKALREKFPQRVFLVPHIAASTENAGIQTDKNTVASLVEIAKVFAGEVSYPNAGLDYVVKPRSEQRHETLSAVRRASRELEALSDDALKAKIEQLISERWLGDSISVLRRQTSAALLAQFLMYTVKDRRFAEVRLRIQDAFLKRYSEREYDSLTLRIMAGALNEHFSKDSELLTRSLDRLKDLTRQIRTDKSDRLEIMEHYENAVDGILRVLTVIGKAKPRTAKKIEAITEAVKPLIGIKKTHGTTRYTAWSVLKQLGADVKDLKPEILAAAYEKLIPTNHPIVSKVGQIKSVKVMRTDKQGVLPGAIELNPALIGVTDLAAIGASSFLADVASDRRLATLVKEMGDELAADAMRGVLDSIHELQGEVIFGEGAGEEFDNVRTLNVGDQVGGAHENLYHYAIDRSDADIAVDPVELTEGLAKESVNGSTALLLVSERGSLHKVISENYVWVVYGPNGSKLKAADSSQISIDDTPEYRALKKMAAANVKSAAQAKGPNAKPLTVGTLFRDRHQSIIKAYIESGIQAAYPMDIEEWLKNRTAYEGAWVTSSNERWKFEDYWAFVKRIIKMNGTYGISGPEAQVNQLKLFNDGTVSAVRAVGHNLLDVMIGSSKYAETLAQTAMAGSYGLSFDSILDGKNVARQLVQKSDNVVHLTSIKPDAWDPEVKGVVYSPVFKTVTVQHEAIGASGATVVYEMVYQTTASPMPKNPFAEAATQIFFANGLSKSKALFDEARRTIHDIGVATGSRSTHALMKLLEAEEILVNAKGEKIEDPLGSAAYLLFEALGTDSNEYGLIKPLLAEIISLLKAEQVNLRNEIESDRLAGKTPESIRARRIDAIRVILDKVDAKSATPAGMISEIGRSEARFDVLKGVGIGILIAGIGAGSYVYLTKENPAAVQKREAEAAKKENLRLALERMGYRALDLEKTAAEFTNGVFLEEAAKGTQSIDQKTIDYWRYHDQIEALPLSAARLETALRKGVPQWEIINVSSADGGKIVAKVRVPQNDDAVYFGLAQHLKNQGIAQSIKLEEVPQDEIGAPSKFLLLSVFQETISDLREREYQLAIENIETQVQLKRYKFTEDGKSSKKFQDFARDLANRRRNDRAAKLIHPDSYQPWVRQPEILDLPLESWEEEGIIKPSERHEARMTRPEMMKLLLKSPETVNQQEAEDLFGRMPKSETVFAPDFQKLLTSNVEWVRHLASDRLHHLNVEENPELPYTEIATLDQLRDFLDRAVRRNNLRLPGINEGLLALISPSNIEMVRGAKKMMVFDDPEEKIFAINVLTRIGAEAVNEVDAHVIPSVRIIAANDPHEAVRAAALQFLPQVPAAVSQPEVEAAPIADDLQGFFDGLAFGPSGEKTDARPENRVPDAGRRTLLKTGVAAVTLPLLNGITQAADPKPFLVFKNETSPERVRVLKALRDSLKDRKLGVFETKKLLTELDSTVSVSIDNVNDLYVSQEVTQAKRAIRLASLETDAKKRAERIQGQLKAVETAYSRIMDLEAPVRNVLAEILYIIARDTKDNDVKVSAAKIMVKLMEADEKSFKFFDTKVHGDLLTADADGTLSARIKTELFPSAKQREFFDTLVLLLMPLADKLEEDIAPLQAEVEALVKKRGDYEKEKINIEQKIAVFRASIKVEEEKLTAPKVTRRPGVETPRVLGLSEKLAKLEAEGASKNFDEILRLKKEIEKIREKISDLGRQRQEQIDLLTRGDQQYSDWGKELTPKSIKLEAMKRQAEGMRNAIAAYQLFAARSEARHVGGFSARVDVQESAKFSGGTQDVSRAETMALKMAREFPYIAIGFRIADDDDDEIKWEPLPESGATNVARERIISTFVKQVITEVHPADSAVKINGAFYQVGETTKGMMILLQLLKPESPEPAQAQTTERRRPFSRSEGEGGGSTGTGLLDRPSPGRDQRPSKRRDDVDLEDSISKELIAEAEALLTPAVAAVYADVAEHTLPVVWSKQQVETALKLIKESNGAEREKIRKLVTENLADYKALADTAKASKAVHLVLPVDISTPAESLKLLALALSEKGDTIHILLQGEGVDTAKAEAYEKTLQQNLIGLGLGDQTQQIKVTAAPSEQELLRQSRRFAGDQSQNGEERGIADQDSELLEAVGQIGSALRMLIPSEIKEETAVALLAMAFLRDDAKEATPGVMSVKAWMQKKGINGASLSERVRLAALALERITSAA